MDYFSKFLRTTPQPPPKVQVDHAQEFHKAWNSVKDTLLMPDERQLTKGITSTEVPTLLRSMVDSLVWESTRTEEGGTGACLEYLLKNDVLGTLVRLSENDRPPGIQAEVLRAVSNMVVLLDEQFLVHSAVHKAVLRLLRNCVGDDLQEQLDGRSKLMGAARDVVRSQPSEHEEDLVNLLCILCSRIRTYRDLLMIFFHDKHWYRSEPLFSVEEEEGEEDEEDEEEDEEDEEEEEKEKEEEEEGEEEDPDTTIKAIKIQPSDVEETGPSSPTPSRKTVTSNQPHPPEFKKPEYEFLLFNYLLRFVHREGHIGEFARAGLLFLMDVAMSSGETNTSEDSPVADPVNDAALALAEYILDGDFSEVLGAGLSAVYSLLPSKLGFFPQTASTGSDNAMTIGGPSISDEEEKEKILDLLEKSRALGIEDARSPEFKAKMDHFLTLLMFLQDVLRRNVSHESVDASALVGTAIVQSILDAVRRIFLENVLYPSILECSDIDGSAVAVMSYIEIMVRTLREGPLASLLVDFLVSEDNDDPRFRQRAQPVVTLGIQAEEKRKKNRRRQSSAMTLLEMEAPGSRKPTDYFTSMGRFTLKDLLISNLKSKSQTTATSAMQLFQTMLTYHPQLTTERLLLVIPDSLATTFPHPAIQKRPETSMSLATMNEDDDDDEFFYPGAEGTKQTSTNSYSNQSLLTQPQTTYSTHEREMALYLALVSRVDPSHSDEGDIFSTGYDHYLHDALVTIQSQPVYWNTLEDSEYAAPRLKHRLNVNDQILSLVLESLTTFFSNTPEFNVGLTGVLATLATHPDRSMADSPDHDGDDRSIDFSIEEKLANDTNFLPAASMDDKSRPIVYTIFQGLVNQLERYRQSVENFDKFLLERRQGLLFSENLTDALNLALDLTDDPRPVKRAPEPVQAPKPKPKPSVTSSFVPSFLTVKKNKPTTKPSPQPAEPELPRQAVPKTVSASPFGSHYKHTGTVKVESYVASVPSSGPWTPSKAKKWNVAEEDIFNSAWGDNLRITSKQEEVEEVDEKPAPVTLSQLLDNVVILEESIKELVAIIHARRSLGIDSLRYL
ncbi:Retinoic acid induced 16-like protein-domain-containing protein [Pholiota molesta]|nr:Retinoic acid induced 16-like protein-domain-containing protein [Pholiota molesta]